MDSLASLFPSRGRHVDSLLTIPTPRTGSDRSVLYDEPSSRRLGSSLSILPSITDVVTAETNKDLKEAIGSAIYRCDNALKLSHKKFREANEEKSALFESNKNVLGEFHELAEKHQHIYDEREKLFKRLPSNQVVNVVHNALLEEHEKENMLIEESYAAVKFAKSDLHEKRARRVEQAQEIHDGEVGALEMQIAHLRNIAEIAGVALDCPIFTVQYDFSMHEAREPFRLPPVSQTQSSFTPAEPRQTIDPSAYNINFNRGILDRASSCQKSKKDPGSARDETVKRCNDCKAPLGYVDGDAQATSTAIVHKKAVNPYPEHDTLWGWIRRFVQQGQHILSEIQGRYEDEIDAASSQRAREQNSIDSGLQKRAEQRARIGKIRDVVGKLWETEKKNEKQWDAAWEMTNDEMKIIKKELESFENHVPRCDDKLFARCKAAEALLVKQKKFYEALLYRFETEAAGRGLDLGVSE